MKRDMAMTIVRMFVRMLVPKNLSARPGDSGSSSFKANFIASYSLFSSVVYKPNVGCKKLS